jgi:hypothetical protein
VRRDSNLTLPMSFDMMYRIDIGDGCMDIEYFIGLRLFKVLSQASTGRGPVCKEDRRFAAAITFIVSMVRSGGELGGGVRDNHVVF